MIDGLNLSVANQTEALKKILQSLTYIVEVLPMSKQRENTSPCNTG